MTEYSRSIAKTKDGEYIFDEGTKTFLIWVGEVTLTKAQRPNDQSAASQRLKYKIV